MKITLLTAALLSAAVCTAQQPIATPTQATSQTQTQAAISPNQAALTLPAGTRLLLVLRRSFSTRTTHPGDGIYLQTSGPAAVDGKTAIPAGSYVQGTVEKIIRHGAGQRPDVQVKLASVTLANGYTVGIPGSITINSAGVETYYEHPDISTSTWLMAAGAPVAGFLIGGFAVPAKAPFANQPQNLPGLPPLPTLSPVRPPINVVGAAVGGGVGAGLGLTALLMSRNKDVFMDIGAPAEIVLDAPLVLNADRVQDAILHYKAPQLPSIPPPPPVVYDNNTPTGTCYTPGTPGTPDTVIPGIPATPDSPGTPDTVIPGTPSTPGTPYPC